MLIIPKEQNIIKIGFNLFINLLHDPIYNRQVKVKINIY